MTGPTVTGPRYDPAPPVPWRRQARVYAGLLRPRPPRPDPGRFLVFAQGRTGSTLLVDLLNASPLVRCDEEILARRVTAPGLWVGAHRRRHPDHVYGFKVKIYQLTEDQRIADPGGWLRVMAGRGWRCVYLWRRNPLRHALSNMAAARAGGFVHRGGAAPDARGVVVDVDLLLAAAQARERLAAAERAALAGLEHVEVCYEDDLLDPSRHQPTLDRLCAGLGVPPAPARTDVRRVVSAPLAETLANYDAVAAALRGSRWERFLADGAPR